MNQITLSRNMSCPSCNRQYREASGSRFFPVCQSKVCRIRWWSMELVEGDLHTQLAVTFGNRGATEIERQLANPPARVVPPAYLQIRLTQPQYLQQFHQDTRLSLPEWLWSILKAA